MRMNSLIKYQTKIAEFANSVSRVENTRARLFKTNDVVS